jgi:hypothetical protein
MHMIKISLAILFSFVSLLGQIYFSHSSGPHHFLYQILCILLIPVIIFLSYSGRQDLLDKKKIKDNKDLKPLKENGERIIVTYENCSFKGNSFDIQVISSPP